MHFIGQNKHTTIKANKVDVESPAQVDDSLSSAEKKAIEISTKCPYLKRLVIFYVLQVALVCHGPIMDVVTLLRQPDIDVTSIVLISLSCYANLAVSAFMMHATFLVVRFCLVLEFEASALVEDVTDGVVDSWKSVCVLSRVIDTTFERIRTSCATCKNTVTDRWIFFTCLMGILLLIAFTEFYLSMRSIPIWIFGIFLASFIEWFIMILALGKINSQTNKLADALHAERTRLTDQLGALSLSLVSHQKSESTNTKMILFEEHRECAKAEEVEQGADIHKAISRMSLKLELLAIEQQKFAQQQQKFAQQQQKLSAEMARLQAIIARVQALSTQNMNVAWFSGIPITQDMVKTLAAKSLFVFYVLSQFLILYSHALNFSENFGNGY